MTRVLRALALCSLMFSMVIESRPLRAQVATGTPPFGSFGGGPDVINLTNLNSHITIPIFYRAGRGIDFNYALSYDSSIWSPASGSWAPNGTWGWTNSISGMGYMTYSETISTGTCTGSNGRPGRTVTTTEYWTYLDGMGSPHSFPVPSGTYSNGCTGQNSQSGFVNQLAQDGSAYSLTATGTTFNSMKNASGAAMGPTVNSLSGAATLIDRNGNEISSSSGGVYTDTLGTTALTASGSGTPASPTRLTYAAPSGASPYFQVAYTTYTVQTKFSCSGITEFGANGTTTANLVSEIDLPDGSKYIFGYETTPGDMHSPHFVTGRLTSIQFPTGGTITYAYSGGSNGINCADGSTATLTRTTNPGGQWIYARSQVSGSHWQTQITTPLNDTTILHSQQTGISSYETQRLTYQGSTAGTLLQTLTTCYNGNTTSCPNTAVSVPITQRNVTTQFGTNGLQALSVSKYNSYGLPTEEDHYDFTNGTPTNILRQTLTSYASLGNGIVSMPWTITVKDGVGNVKSLTTYTYDSGTLATSSGTPQHVSITGSRGNATTIASSVTGSTSLNRTFTYYDTGMLNVATDVNGQSTTMVYANATATCGNAFPTGVSEPLNLSKSFAWNCIGAVQIQITDENGQNTNTNYNDVFFWRPNTVTDPSGAATTYSYPTASPYNWLETSMPIVSGSAVGDVRTTVDGLGRKILQQKKQGPSSSYYDTVETDYDSIGRIQKVTLPFATTAGSTNASAPGTSWVYDALSRATSISDSGGGSVSYTYTQNDAYVSANPAPTGENTKRRQLEYNGLGQLTSVCEVTSLSGSGSCAQTSAATGYWTKYSYNPFGQLTVVTQNAQSSSIQTRTFSYDLLGRLISESNPESGTTTYTYDSANVGTCSITSNGDLIMRSNAAGVSTCNGYDALHRLISVGHNPAQANSTPDKFFVYDSATVNGTSMAYAKGRLAEAYTCMSPCVKITDIGLGYTARGERSDIYESTPHSSGYYHVAETYLVNGGPNTLAFSGISALPSFTFGPDAEGRVGNVNASAGQNPLTAISYSPAGSPTSITYGSSDTDAFSYDPSTNRLTQYQFNINSQSLVANLTWNANSSLQSLAITDALNSSDTQTCNYSHDDLSRIQSVSCGSAWAQTFGYDAFGNVTKSGSMSWGAIYNLSTNRVSSVGSFTPTYDPNGNTLTDPSHTYTWDADGKAVTIDSVSVTYDALGRMTEQNRSGNYTELVYSPNGGKFAIMNGQALQKAIVPLPAGSQAVYGAGGLLYYGHSDHLGSIKLASTPTRTFYFGLAYAPFGEVYASSGTIDPVYTTQREDTVSDLFDFPAREYSDEGRWHSPDPAGLKSVSLALPQTLNRYAYVSNNPMTFIDPLGLGKCKKYADGICGTPNPPAFGGDGGGCSMDGIEVDCSYATGFLSGSDGLAVCPNNVCSGFGVNGQGQTVYAQYYAFAGGTAGYFDPTEFAGGINDVNGKIYSDADYQAYLRATYISQIAGQFNRLSANLNAVFGNTASADFGDPNIVGGHANFDFTCTDWSVCGPGRYDDGIHVECASGETSCSSGPLVVHDDTVSPWTGQFTFSAIFTLNLWEHGFVDLFGGSFCNCVFSH